jgi:hypothetical protein
MVSAKEVVPLPPQNQLAANRLTLAVDSRLNAATGARIVAREGDPMSSKLSVADVLANLESRAAFHRERRAFHAGQEEQHREERERHAAELERVLHNLDAFRTASASAVEIIEQPQSQEPEAPAPQVDSPVTGKLMVSRAIRAVVASWKEGEPFGASAVAAEVNRRFADRLRRPIGTRATSDVLRRIARSRQIHQVRRGKALAEGLYVRGGRG